MDPATIVGVVLGFVAVFGTQILEGGSPMSILLIPPLFLVFGGFGAAPRLASNTMPGMMGGIKWLVYAMTAKKSDRRGRRRAPGEARRAGPARGPAGPGGRRWRRSTTPS